ncbi:MAG: AsmA-like C-terminal region-containing protein [Bacteroidota bacterium]
MISTLVVTSIIFKEDIINGFIAEANKSLNTKLHVEHTDISVFEHFPEMSLSLQGVMLEGSTDQVNDTLLVADKISFTFHSFELFKGNYTFNEVYIADGWVDLKRDSLGNTNYQVYKSDSSATDKGSINFALEHVALNNFKVGYTDQVAAIEVVTMAQALEASVVSVNEIHQISASGRVETEQVAINNGVFLRNKEWNLDSDLNIDLNENKLTIKPSALNLPNAEFEIYGEHVFSKEAAVELFVEGKNTDVQTILALLPEKYAQSLSKYRSDGAVYFNASLEGLTYADNSPSLAIKFGFKDASISHPDFEQTIDNLFFEGWFISKSIQRFNDAELALKQVSGSLEQRAFKGNFTIRNLENPYINTDFQGTIDAASALPFLSSYKIESAYGLMGVDIDLKGRLKDLDRRSTAQRVRTSGEINLKDLGFQIGKRGIFFNKLNGNLLFNNNDIAISNVSGTLGNSDFLLNGFFKNIITFLLFEGQPLGIESDLKSDLIDLDELLTGDFEKNKDEDESGSYAFDINPNLLMDFNCDIKRLKFRRLDAKDIKGRLFVKNQLASTKGITLKALGGSASFDGYVDAGVKDSVNVYAESQLKGIHIDSLFYVFEDFGQNFLSERHLKGQVEADIVSALKFDKNLNLDKPSLTSDLKATIVNGELNSFEPMQKLSRFFDQQELSALRFNELKNEIHIENQTIYVPVMEVGSNVTDIKISGTHTFSQAIDYRLIAPLRGKPKQDSDEAFGAIEDDGVGKPKIHLKITGTTEDYQVAYDVQSVKKKIAKDLKKEVNELKAAFRNKGRKEKQERELDDEYFDWDEEEDDN